MLQLHIEQTEERKDLIELGSRAGSSGKEPAWYQNYYGNGEYVRAVESGTERNYNMMDGIANNRKNGPRIIGGWHPCLIGSGKSRRKLLCETVSPFLFVIEISADMERNRK